MSGTTLHARVPRRPTLSLSLDERAQLSAILDLLIPSDDDFPPPSSLHLIDTLLQHLRPGTTDKTALMLDEQQLRMVLRNLNLLANGDFCRASIEVQHGLLKHLEQQHPAIFQALWTLTNHSYYAALATRKHTQPTRQFASVPSPLLEVTS